MVHALRTGIKPAGGAHGGQLHDVLAPGHEVADCPEWLALIRAVQSRHDHNLAGVGSALGEGYQVREKLSLVHPHHVTARQLLLRLREGGAGDGRQHVTVVRGHVVLVITGVVLVLDNEAPQTGVLQASYAADQFAGLAGEHWSAHQLDLAADGEAGTRCGPRTAMGGGEYGAG